MCPRDGTGSARFAGAPPCRGDHDPGGRHAREGAHAHRGLLRWGRPPRSLPASPLPARLRPGEGASPLLSDGSFPLPESEQTEDELQEEIAKVSGAGRGGYGSGGCAAIALQLTSDTRLFSLPINHPETCRQLVICGLTLSVCLADCLILLWVVSWRVACPGPPGGLQKESSGGQLAADQEWKESRSTQRAPGPGVFQPWKRGEAVAERGLDPAAPCSCGCPMKQWHRGGGLGAGALGNWVERRNNPAGRDGPGCSSPLQD